MTKTYLAGELQSILDHIVGNNIQLLLLLALLTHHVKIEIVESRQESISLLVNAFLTDATCFFFVRLHGLFSVSCGLD